MRTLERDPKVSRSLLDPFGWLNKKEKEKAKAYAENTNVPKPGNTVPLAWEPLAINKTKRTTGRRQFRLDRELGEIRIVGNSLCCDVHPYRYAEFLVARAGNRGTLKVGNVVCSQCERQRSRYSSYYFLRIPRSSCVRHSRVAEWITVTSSNERQGWFGCDRCSRFAGSTYRSISHDRH